MSKYGILIAAALSTTPLVIGGSALADSSPGGHAGGSADRSSTLRSAEPLTMSGYHEISGTGNIGKFAASEQKKYLKEKAELQNQIRKCENGEPCSRNLKAFTEMLQKVRRLRDPTAKMIAINGWINLSIAYDLHEATLANRQHRTLLQAIIDRKAVCDEQAALKLFALEETGFKPNDVRYVIEKIYINGKLQPDSHAVAIARVKKDVWVLADQHQPFSKIVSSKDANLLMDENASVETDATHANYAGKTTFDVPGIKIPICSYNSHSYQLYDSHVRHNISDMTIPDHIKNVTPRIVLMSTPGLGTHLDHVVAIGNVADILKPALSVQYRVAPSLKANAVQGADLPRP